MVNESMAADYAKSNQLMFFETSAKTGEAVFDVFLRIAENIKIEQTTFNKYEKIKAFGERRNGCCSG